MLLQLIFALWSSCVMLATAQQQPIVTTLLGSIKGLTFKTASGKEFSAFEGIPFAKPPVGKHRFKPAVPFGGWTGVWNATKEPNGCMQLPMEMIMPNLPFDVVGSEDCLYVNVYTPKATSQTKLLDVLVYIHGGGFVGGQGTMAGPKYLMDRDVVLVSFNYRLGILGFLSFGDDVVPGNNGLKDQVLALQWVNDHIAAFGGDPNKITIAGASAGGASVHFHLLSPMSKGLFHKAISSSGSALNPWAVSTIARSNALTISQALGCPVDDVLLTLKCLRERPAERLVKAADVLKLFQSDTALPLPFAPVVEQPAAGAFIDRHPLEIITSNDVNDVPVLFTYDNDEGSLFALWATKDENDRRAFEEEWDRVLPPLMSFSDLVSPTRAIEISKEIRSQFLGDKNIAESQAGLSKVFGERLFEDGIQKAAMYHAQYQKSPVYSYRFSCAPKDKELEFLKMMFPNVTYEGGAVHAQDNLYVLSMPFLVHEAPASKAMSKTMIDYWLTFMTEGPSALWPTVKSGLPKFTFKEIIAPEPEKNIVKQEVPVGQMFWDSLKIPLALSNNIEHTEL